MYHRERGELVLQNKTLGVHISEYYCMGCDR